MQWSQNQYIIAIKNWLYELIVLQMIDLCEIISCTAIFWCPYLVAVTVLSWADFSLSHILLWSRLWNYPILCASFFSKFNKVLGICPKENLFTIESFSESGIIDLPDWSCFEDCGHHIVIKIIIERIASNFARHFIVLYFPWCS